MLCAKIINDETSATMSHVGKYRWCVRVFIGGFIAAADDMRSLLVCYKRAVSSELLGKHASRDYRVKGSTRIGV